MVVCNPDFSNSAFDFSMRSGNLEIGTATIPSITLSKREYTIRRPNLALSLPQRQNRMQRFLNHQSKTAAHFTFRADQSCFFSASLRANSNLIAFASLASSLIVWILSLTPPFVPANLMKRVGFSSHFFPGVAFVALIVRIWLSSRSSMAATSTPERTVLATTFAAS
jgi:hypothetical protein